MRLRPGLLTAAAALCIASGVAWAQYVEDSIDVGHAWVGSLVYNSREDVVYGASEEGLFFVISCDSNRLIQTLPVQHPFLVGYDSTDNKAYCTIASDSLLVIDGVTHSRIKSLPMYGATVPVWDAISDRVYVSCQDMDQVAVVDCVIDSLLAYIPVGACPMKMYINTLRRKLYVLNYDDGTVSIVNMTTNQVIKTLFVDGTPNAGYYSRRVDKFYSAGNYGECIVIGGESDSIVARIALPGTNADLLSATGNEGANLVYLGIHHDGGKSVATVQARDDSLVANATIGGSAWGLAYYSESDLVYSTSLGTDEVCVFPSDGSHVMTTIPVGDGPYVIAVSPRHNRLYVGHSNGPYVYVLRDTSAGVAEPRSPRSGVSEATSVTPNPFRRNAAVIWNSPASVGEVVRLYAQDGRLVRQARLPAGQSRWVWDGRDDSGATLPPGVYVLESGPGVRAKVVKLK